MQLKIFQVDAFTDRVFGGNPAAVCVLNKWLPEIVMQAIATENNLPETAFLCPSQEDYLIRWFTPSVEVDLCGHATLASAHVVFNQLSHPSDTVVFKSNSGPLAVNKDGDELRMNFPALELRPSKATSAIIAALGVTPKVVVESMDYIVVVESVEQLKKIEPNFDRIRALELRGVMVTAASVNNGVDFVSRYFAPKLDIYEDFITGSAHCALVPYWSCELDKTFFNAQQISKRVINLRCELQEDRVLLFGKTALYMEGSIFIPDNITC